jgi:hypothetical protein
MIASPGNRKSPRHEKAGGMPPGRQHAAQPNLPRDPIASWPLAQSTGMMSLHQRPLGYASGAGDTPAKNGIKMPIWSDSERLSKTCSQMQIWFDSERCVGNVGIPKGFPSGGGRVESRHFGFPSFPLLVISNAHACQCEVGSSAIITDAKRVCEDSSRLVCEKTRAPITVIALSPPVPFHLLGN